MAIAIMFLFFSCDNEEISLQVASVRPLVVAYYHQAQNEHMVVSEGLHLMLSIDTQSDSDSYVVTISSEEHGLSWERSVETVTIDNIPYLIIGDAVLPPGIELSDGPWTAEVFQGNRRSETTFNINATTLHPYIVKNAENYIPHAVLTESGTTHSQFDLAYPDDLEQISNLTWTVQLMDTNKTLIGTLTWKGEPLPISNNLVNGSLEDIAYIICLSVDPSSGSIFVSHNTVK